MIYLRVFIAAAVLLGAYIIYDTAAVAIAKSNAFEAGEIHAFGPEDADLTVVEFIDYQCPHCQKMNPILMRSINRDENVRLVVRPLPTSQGEHIMQPALLPYAAGRQGKFKEAHDELIENFRTIDEDYISDFALRVGLDTQQLEADLKDPALYEQLVINTKILRGLDGYWIPNMLIGDRLFLQVRDEIPNSDELVNLFNHARRL